jgi:hypothetical protein
LSAHMERERAEKQSDERFHFAWGQRLSGGV